MRVSGAVSVVSVLINGLLMMAGLFCLNVHAGEFTPQALIEKSGMGVHLDFMPRSLKIAVGHAMKNGALKLSVEQIRNVHAAFDHAYAPPKLRMMIAERIPGRVSAEQGGRMIAFLESPLGRRIVERESRLAQPKIQAEIEENSSRIIADAGANSTRLALYSALDQAMGSTQRAVKTYMGSSLAVNAAILAVMPDTPDRPSLEEIKKTLDSQRLAITGAMSQAVLGNSAYAYQDLSEEELNSYLQFVLSPEGKAYSLEFGDIVAEVMVECAFDAGMISGSRKPAPI